MKKLRNELLEHCSLWIEIIRLYHRQNISTTATHKLDNMAQKATDRLEKICTREIRESVVTFNNFKIFKKVITKYYNVPISLR